MAAALPTTGFWPIGERDTRAGVLPCHVVSSLCTALWENFRGSRGTFILGAVLWRFWVFMSRLIDVLNISKNISFYFTLEEGSWSLYEYEKREQESNVCLVSNGALSQPPSCTCSSRLCCTDTDSLLFILWTWSIMSTSTHYLHSFFFHDINI